jgi:uncharacterized protein (TIGR03083 family)
MPDLWAQIHAERRALAEDLATLTPEQWAHPSLCRGWSVRDVVAHLAASAKLTPGKFFPALMASGFRFNVMGEQKLAEELGASPKETLANFNATIETATHPPGPATAMLGEIVVHSADIRRPLGISTRPSPEAMLAVARLYRSSNMLIGAKHRTAGLRLRATDLAWTSGAGPEVEGPLESLVLAMCGRADAFDDLAGEGAMILKARR